MISLNAPSITRIQPHRGWQWLDFSELWRYRELLYFLTWRDIKVRYKQAVLGAAWAIFQPLAMMIILSLFLRRESHLFSSEIPYPLFLFSGLLPWVFFANAINGSGQSVVASQNMVRKVYFPRFLIPMGAVGTSLVDFAVAFIMLVVLMLGYRRSPSWEMLLLPILVVGLMAAALGIGTFIAALTVAYRDFRYIVPFLVQLWMFATPSVYRDLETLRADWRLWLPLSPPFGLIVNFRAAALGLPLDFYCLAVSMSVGLILLVAGSLYFRRVERTFADIV
jgi:lipopolysaccharide transport system permease protein